jgi:hypothetical protein
MQRLGRLSVLQSAPKSTEHAMPVRGVAAPGIVTHCYPRPMQYHQRCYAGHKAAEFQRIAEHDAQYKERRGDGAGDQHKPNVFPSQFRANIPARSPVKGRAGGVFLARALGPDRASPGLKCKEAVRQIVFCDCGVGVFSGVRSPQPPFLVSHDPPAPVPTPIAPIEPAGSSVADARECREAMCSR